jgi:hypothetical protein
MIARYPGRCARTGAAIRPGDAITPLGRKRYALAQHAAPVDTIDPDLALAESIDPDLAQSDPEAAAAAGRYLRQSLARGVSHVWSANGREYYRNRAGRCEDAPCCGCCNA